MTDFILNVSIISLYFLAIFALIFNSTIHGFSINDIIDNKLFWLLLGGVTGISLGIKAKMLVDNWPRLRRWVRKKP